MSWKTVFNTEYFSIGLSFDAIYEIVKKSKYPYYVWNEMVYETVSKRGTGYLASELV